jgi:hypothetical protein
MLILILVNGHILYQREIYAPNSQKHRRNYVNIKQKTGFTTQQIIMTFTTDITFFEFWGSHDGDREDGATGFCETLVTTRLHDITSQKTC